MAYGNKRTRLFEIVLAKNDNGKIVGAGVSRLISGSVYLTNEEGRERIAFYGYSFGNKVTVTSHLYKKSSKDGKEYYAGSTVKRLSPTYTVRIHFTVFEGDGGIHARVSYTKVTARRSPWFQSSVGTSSYGRSNYGNGGGARSYRSRSYSGYSRGGKKW